MATAAGFKTLEMNWDATDLRDELSKFMTYSATSNESVKEQATFIVLWIARQGSETYNKCTLRAI